LAIIMFKINISQPHSQSGLKKKHKGHKRILEVKINLL
ncbi:jg477, partial [Pararge aegeria aegeria]